MKLTIDESRCKGCSLCTAVCPFKIFKEGTKLNKKGIVVPEFDRTERCTVIKTGDISKCGICRLTCPDQAVHWIPDADAGANES